MKTWQKIKQNPKLLNQYLVREKVTDTIRTFFKDQGFREVSTPILVPTPSAESNLEVFETQLRTSKGVKKRGFLIMSPEYSIKKLLAAGIGSCFEITKCFRNEEEVSRLHNHEFTMLEWYRVGANYTDVMQDFENLFVKIVQTVNSSCALDSWLYQEKSYDLSLPWPRISVKEAFETFAATDVTKIDDEDFYKIFFNEIEPKLAASNKPFFIYDYPISQASLSRPKKEDSRFAERFEAFLAGVELGNCFSELIDPVEQESRFKSDLSQRENQHKTEYSIDYDLIDALKSGLPEVSGIAVGVDRLVMLAANMPTVSDTLFFPSAEIFDLEATD
jgi:lysyl-tRNA synthetase class 2